MDDVSKRVPLHLKSKLRLNKRDCLKNFGAVFFVLKIHCLFADNMEEMPSLESIKVYSLTGSLIYCSDIRFDIQSIYLNIRYLHT
jgi:hypothetical protein